MPSFILKADPQRDAYIEWSTVVDAPTDVGDRAYFLTKNAEDRMARADEAGTSARYFDWLPPEEQAGGWVDPYLIYEGAGTLPRERLGDVFDLLVADPDARIPDEWLHQWEDVEQWPAVASAPAPTERNRP